MVCNSFVMFLSARPGRGATTSLYSYARCYKFLSARPGRGATKLLKLPHPAIMVSIRTPRAGRDMPISLAFNGFIIVSIRTPRAGRDEQHEQSRIKRLWFLSARPGRGATSGVTLAAKSIKVSIRTPRAGRDDVRWQCANMYILFLSARPGRGATAF